MILNHLKWWAGSNKDPSFRFYFDLILKLSPSSVNVKSSQSESILDFTSEGLQAISSVSSIINLQVHFISFKKLFYTFENYNFSNFCSFRNFTPFWLFLKIKYEILLKKNEKFSFVTDGRDRDRRHDWFDNRHNRWNYYYFTL